MSKMEAVLQKLTSLMQDCFDDDDLVATPAMTAADVPGWDSLANVRLMLMVERAFKVRFAAAEIAGFRNVGDLAASIIAKAPPGAAAP
jgi:acyl carrier protein